MDSGEACIYTIWNWTISSLQASHFRFSLLTLFLIFSSLCWSLFHFCLFSPTSLIFLFSSPYYISVPFLNLLISFTTNMADWLLIWEKRLFLSVLASPPPSPVHQTQNFSEHRQKIWFFLLLPVANNKYHYISAEISCM